MLLIKQKPMVITACTSLTDIVVSLFYIYDDLTTYADLTEHRTSRPGVGHDITLLGFCDILIF